MVFRVATGPAEGVPVAAVEDGYLTDGENAARLKWSTKTLEKKVRQGVFKEGVHYFQRPGMRRRWKWSAVVRWLEQGNDGVTSGVSIPLAGVTESVVTR